ncbi:NADH-cytochrome b5 reductase-like isoform X4 [Dermacentor andersoni]|uniref:NADH-cytochrome b5 reductase-like isoform X4 n=1 Tax=Dermacentor andersoni TaxID=34620 RepID=UPI0024162A1C|nr:NADH-cytochrome b5 reductase-like isoform X4 [Dermacentor andersoni]
MACTDTPSHQARISEELLARKPRQPAAAECCGNGCALCVNDVYEQELAIWEMECMRELQYGPGRHEPQQGPAISPDYYKSFVLRNIEKITECCSRYVFVIDGIRRLGFSIGQHLIMRASVDGEIVTRQYTPISPPSVLGFFEVIIKVYPQGRMSKYIKTLKEGCSVDWRGPLGGLDYKPNVHKHMLLLAAGTGIAPMIQVLHHITSSDEDYTMVRLLFGIAKYRDIYLKNELNQLKAFWNVSILYCLSDVSTKETKVEDLKYGDEVYCREIDEELLEVELSKYRTPPHVLLCGPNTFNSRFVNYLKTRTDSVTWHIF